uniref:5-hydroxytryptamine receptor 3C-like n=1 Tax=Salarias fasciatus TaxID=181472 RepID=A0A672FD62_SALFA
MFLTGSFLLIFLTGGFSSSPPPVPVSEDTAGLPGPVETEDYSPGHYYDDPRLPGGFSSSPPPVPTRVPEGTPKPECGMRGTFDSAEFHAKYVLNMTNPPEYLREYFASFYDSPDPCDLYCNYDQVIDKLQLDKLKEKLTLSRPVQSHRILTYVYLEMVIASILNVKASEQLFVTHMWLYMSWNNQFISWDPQKFCGIKHIVVRSDTLWKPDIIIEEMLEKDKIAPSPFLKVNSFGEVEHRIDQVVTGTCRMNVYKFPYDTQRCTISFKSLMHSDDEIRFVVNTNTTVISKWSHHAMQSKHEWRFVKMTVTNKTNSFYFGSNQTVIVYTVFMQRRPIQHAVNFLLPIFFFLCMDLASYLIPDSGEQKISFRITVLLAVTVLQLILHEILPSSSDRVPLIAVYCIGIFFMMLISLLEAILATYLIQKDSETQDCRTDGDQSSNSERTVSFCGFSKEWKNSSKRSSLRHTPADQTPSDSKETNSEKPEVSMT